MPNEKKPADPGKPLEPGKPDVEPFSAPGGPPPPPPPPPDPGENPR